MKKLKVLKVTPKEFEVKEIENSLDSLQNEVEGYIEIFRLDESFVIILNEEGKLKNLEISLILRNEFGNYEELVGNLIFCKVTKNGNFVSLSESEINMFMENNIFRVFRLLKV